MDLFYIHMSIEMHAKSQNLKWGVEQRMEFIEFRLFWEGGVNRSDITTFFGVSIPQASKDLTQYQELAPRNAEYDRSEKRYFASQQFEPVFLAPSAETYLTQLVRADRADRTIASNWVATPPSAEILPTLHRRVDVTVLRTILSAIRDTGPVEILYQSMTSTSPKPAWRLITPHAFGSDGLRWHVRAYCHKDGKFKDFLLSRCSKARSTTEDGADTSKDNYWNEYFNVFLIPNPALSEAQREAIATDYGMRDSALSVPVRKAMLYYFEKRLRLDVAAKLDNPKETPVLIKNRSEFTDALLKASQ